MDVIDQSHRRNEELNEDVVAWLAADKDASFGEQLWVQY